MSITKQRLDEIVVELIEGGCGARQNDWASHQDFAFELLTALENEHFKQHRTVFIDLPLVRG